MDNNKNAVEVFNKLAGHYQNKYMNVDLYGKSFDLFCNSIKKENATVLEIACGPGNITRYLLNKRPDLKIFGTDLAPNMVALAKINNPEAEFEVMDCRKIGMIDKKYDAVMCGFCLPYLSKEEAIRLITDAAALLNSGGIFYLSTMEDDYSKSRLQTGSTGDQVFMHYHEGAYLVEALTKNSFRINHLQRQDYPDGETKTTDLLIIAEKIN